MKKATGKQNFFKKEDGKKSTHGGIRNGRIQSHNLLGQNSHILEEWKGRMSKYGKSE